VALDRVAALGIVAPALARLGAAGVAGVDQLDQAQGEGQGDLAGGGGEALSPEELAEMLYQSLLRGDDAMMRAVARQAVRRFAGMEPGRPVGGTYYLYRTLRNLDLDGILERLMEQAQDTADHDMTPLEQRLERDEYEQRVNQLRQEIEAEIRRRLVADRGVDAMAKTLRKPLPEDIDFMHASRDEMKLLRQAIFPLTRKLAVRLARHSAHGWDNPALPDDYIEIGQLLNLSPEAVRQRIGVDPMPAREADGAEVE